MKAMILAAGRGERMMPLTKNTPKPLLKVHGKTLIEHTIDRLKDANITDIVINTAYLGDKIQKYLGNGSQFGVKIQYSAENTALETAGGIIQALPLLDDKPFIVINADVLCNLDLSIPTLPSDSLAHLVLIDNPAHNTNGDFSLNNNKVILKQAKTYTFSGIGIYHPDFFKAHLDSEQKLPLITLFKEAINRKKLTGKYYQCDWQDIGTPERLEFVNKL
ncbi:MAG: N-acetylmuramate alpha-1-phosphate uridylyltransferase [Catillopecten margaritatus gill symbiont]|uniref:N-acetylmuramate alpha-1-phosphate uridylyltransferase n=1 Tax=Catillopecten margaritatus gill symbiont TaxID=3083288 RepID=A0AAU6PG99_9GAMM